MVTTSKVFKFDRWYQYKSLCEISSIGINFSAIQANIAFKKKVNIALLVPTLNDYSYVGNQVGDLIFFCKI